MSKKTMILVFALVVGSWLVLASCGGGGSTPATTTSTSATTTSTSVTTTTTVPAGFYAVSGLIYRGSVEAGVQETILVFLSNIFEGPMFETSPARKTVTLEASAASVSYQLLLPVTQEGFYWLIAAADFSGEDLRYVDVYGWDHASDPAETTPSIEVTGNLINHDLSLFDLSVFPD